MAKRKFDCENCGNQGTITITESEYVNLSDLAYCPFCSADISIDEEPSDEDDDNY